MSLAIPPAARFTCTGVMQVEDLLVHYWSTPGMSAADATKQFATIIANAAS